jgi:hypothetical protein
VGDGPGATIDPHRREASSKPTLFIEELTKTALESGLLQDADTTQRSSRQAWGEKICLRD